MDKTVLVTKDTSNNNMTNSSRKKESFSDFQNNAIFKNTNFDNSIYTTSINPFIRVATPLFDYVLEIEKIKSELNMDEIRDEFISKINNFNEKAVEQKIENMEILVARYIICTFIDEKINASFQDNDNWFNRSLLSIFHNETYGGENFFHLLDKFLKTPAKYINILELMYICLSLGFLGRYRVVNKGDLEINNLKDSLYRQIKIVQGREPLDFFIKAEASKNRFKLFNKVSYPLLIGTIIILIIFIYTIFSYKLYEKSSELNQDYKKIIQKKENKINLKESN